jgi:hypothetical protein
MSKHFEPGSSIRCINTVGASYRGLTAGNVYTVLPKGSDGDCVWIADDDGKHIAPYGYRFEAVPAEPTGEQEVSTHFEVHHVPLPVATSTPQEVITRRPTSQAAAEKFIEQHGGNYVAGTFKIVEVEVIKRTKTVRHVKRNTRTIHELVDAE